MDPVGEEIDPTHGWRRYRRPAPLDADEQLHQTERLLNGSCRRAPSTPIGDKFTQRAQGL